MIKKKAIQSSTLDFCHIPPTGSTSIVAAKSGFMPKTPATVAICLKVLKPAFAKVSLPT